MNKEEVIKFWQNSAKRNFKSAQDLVKTKHNDWALFIYHLAIEKQLKALIVKANKKVPYSHKLDYLAKMTNLTLTDEHLEWLREITTFNVDARYAEEKLELYYRATNTYTKLWAGRCDIIYQWLKQKLQ